MATRKASKKRLKPNNNGEVVDGVLSFVIKGGPHDGQRVEMDALVVKLAADRLMEQHELQQQGEEVLATPEFLIDLDASLKKLGYTSSPMIASRAWQKANEFFVEQQKKTNATPT